MWYGDDIQSLGEKQEENWVSPWAAAHYKLAQQEREIEQAEFQLQNAVDAEDYEMAGGLQQRVERMRAAHPIIPREERIEEAVSEGDYAMAAIFNKDLEAVKEGLGLPKYNVGQSVVHVHRLAPLKGVIMAVDLMCVQTDTWIYTAGCAEKAAQLGYPAEQCDIELLYARWSKQPFYTVLPDLDDLHATDEDGRSCHRPDEIYAWKANPAMDDNPPPVYLPQESLAIAPDDVAIQNPQLGELFSSHVLLASRGRQYKPSGKLRFMTQSQQTANAEARRAASKKFVGIKLQDGTSFLG